MKFRTEITADSEGYTWVLHGYGAVKGVLAHGYTNTLRGARDCARRAAKDYMGMQPSLVQKGPNAWAETFEV